MYQIGDDLAKACSFEVYDKILGDLDILAATLTNIGEEAAAINVRLSRNHMMALQPHVLPDERRSKRATT
jgi:hypothetical protein